MSIDNPTLKRLHKNLGREKGNWLYRILKEEILVDTSRDEVRKFAGQCVDVAEDFGRSLDLLEISDIILEYKISLIFKGDC